MSFSQRNTHLPKSVSEIALNLPSRLRSSGETTDAIDLKRGLTTKSLAAPSDMPVSKR